VLNKLKMAVFAPIPSASESTADRRKTRAVHHQP
jgi:hypothetical protein